MFDKEFYPTPIHVLDMIGLDVRNKIILEPHGGKGDIIDYCQASGASKIYAYELNDDLRKIVSTKAHVLGSDFLESKAEEICMVNTIVMNPPFSSALQHIKHAWNIAPEGCEIYALCNFDSIEGYENGRYGIKSILDKYGLYENLGSVFSNAERKTNCNIGLIKLFKPVVSSEFNFDGFLSTNKEEDYEGTEHGLISYNEIQSYVNRYIGAIKLYDEFDSVKNRINDITKDLGMSNIQVNVGYNDSISNKIDFSIKLQKRSWKKVFNILKIDKFITSSVSDKIDKFVEQQSKYPFTVKNIWKMMEVIVGTSQQTLNEGLIKSVDNFTKHTHENRYNVEGWKTNLGYMLNNKFIVESMVGFHYKTGRLEVKYGSYRSRYLDDLQKVLCNLTGITYNEEDSIYRFSQKLEGLERGEWYEWSFFKIKAFNKGTMHLKFKDLKQWELLNRKYGEIKGFVIPENVKL